MSKVMLSRALQTCRRFKPRYSQSSKSLTTMDEKTLDQRQRVLSRMAQESDANKAWESLWQDGLTPWDLGKPTPALKHELETFLLPKLLQKQQRDTEKPSFSTLVPGCGSGYDLITLADFQNKLIDRNIIASNSKSTVVGLDISRTSLRRTVEVWKTLHANKDSDDDNNNECPTRVQVVHGDFFEPASWIIEHTLGAMTEEDAASKNNTSDFQSASFDFIFDYTFFCALQPSKRSNWGKQIASLLSPEGYLLTLMFPIMNVDKPLQGPPFPVSISEYKKVLEPHGLKLLEEAPRESPNSVPSRAPMELVGWWQKQ